MANGWADAAGLGHLQTLYRVGVLGDLTDAQLLERYLANLDEGAEAGFAALVERHGPMVLRVCRQVLGDPHDAEDAFQATFLVLARSAGSLRRRVSTTISSRSCAMTSRSPSTTEGKAFREWSVNMTSCRAVRGGELITLPA